ncbi:hypothetical protein B0O95_10640 [Mycetohabitans endofungorum]|uniref:Uncharacterized protein n=1 Tax=Mycetohabitans endofungorum TaxID=417203 RepID=A0A2P5KAB5_9BURK|nr:hypothetical protein B0O95_10640 [Mycetohabitans endofungorum]
MTGRNNHSRAGAAWPPHGDRSPHLECVWVRATLSGSRCATRDAQHVALNAMLDNGQYREINQKWLGVDVR